MSKNAINAYNMDVHVAEIYDQVETHRGRCTYPPSDREATAFAHSRTLLQHGTHPHSTPLHPTAYDSPYWVDYEDRGGWTQSGV